MSEERLDDQTEQLLNNCLRTRGGQFQEPLCVARLLYNQDADTSTESVLLRRTAAACEILGSEENTLTPEEAQSLLNEIPGWLSVGDGLGSGETHPNIYRRFRSLYQSQWLLRSY